MGVQGLLTACVGVIDSQVITYDEDEDEDEGNRNRLPLFAGGGSIG